ncbi:MAG: helix-turn-helix transcriptional regulator [Deltaproteobacteria bacterium]|jgi:DNA-binding transcriptional ArsR family regulator|nr:helix-turn-helix transcriptional regulator [Deltaproteobacteria bacterium]
MKSQVNLSALEMKNIRNEVAAILKAISHPQRLMLLCHLADGEKTVGQLEELCGGSQSSISQFLKLMKLEEMLTSEKRGLYVYYSIHDPKIKKLISSLYKIFCNKRG